MNRRWMLLPASAVLALAFVAGYRFAASAQRPGAAPPAAGPELAELAQRVAELEAALGSAPARTLVELPVPEAAELFGQKVPLERPEVREGLAYELVLTAGRPLMPLLWMRRAPGVLPEIEQRLRRAKLPDDLKYVAMIESDLRWTTRSPAGALGLWQFMESTATRHGLRVDRWLDERMDPGRSTDAALRYLAELKVRFGDWYLALAGYNAGENLVSRARTEQGGLGYFDMYLPYETRRYVHRVLAAKLVYEHPERYGLAPMKPLHVPEYRTVEVRVTGKTGDLREIARARGLSYAGLRIANPHVLGPTLPRGTYQLRISSGIAPDATGS
ncbi:MAG: lytic transglycosylase domain-containing protein [Acidobacteria bacterium]|nr:lytic transglycosylase domain-containing protein [Acidobacteriota bacterium]